MKVGVTVNLSPGQPKINGRSQLARLTIKPCLRFLSRGFVVLLSAVEVRDSKSVALPVTKYSYSKMKKEIKILRHGVLEKLSDIKLARFQPNWFTVCRLGL